MILLPGNAHMDEDVMGEAEKVWCPCPVECLGRSIPFFWMVGCISMWKWLIWAVNINSASFTGDYCR